MSSEPVPPATRIDRLSADELLTGFSQSHLVRWFLVAVALHAVVIAGFSIGNIRDLLDPEGAQARRAAALAAPQAAAQAAPPAGPARPAGETSEEAAAPTGTTPVEQATSEAARPGEIPQLPDDLGLSIEDTNPQ